MSNTALFVTQLVSIIGYVGSLFYLYQILVNQKDATIQLLKEKNDWLQSQLDQAKESSPDSLLKQLDQRIKVYAEELQRLSVDKNTTEALLKEKDEEIKRLQADAQETVDRLKRVAKAFSSITDAIRKTGQK